MSATRSTGSALDLAMDFLRFELANGPKPTSQVYAGAMEYGIAVRTLERARKRLGVVHQRCGIPGKKGSGYVVLQLPETPPLPVAPDPVKLSSRPALERAIGFLYSTLANGPVPSRAVYDAARQHGISLSTLERARRELGIIWRREGFEGMRGGGEVIMALPYRKATEEAG